MSTEKRELYNIIDTLPEELSAKVLDYIEYLKFTTIIDEKDIPNELVIKSKEDLIQKLGNAEDSISKGDVFSSEEVFAEIDQILAQ
ncbi:MAG: DUF2281 domain-containing protein [Clostridia bacterium]